MMRVGLYRPVHVKTRSAQELRLLLTARKLLQSKMLDVETELRGTLESFGLRVGRVRKGGSSDRVRELADRRRRARGGRDGAARAPTPRSRLSTRRCDGRLLAVVRDDPVCRRLMSAPGVGPVIALTKATVDVPARLPKSRPGRAPTSA